MVLAVIFVTRFQRDGVGQRPLPPLTHLDALRLFYVMRVSITVWSPRTMKK